MQTTLIITPSSDKIQIKQNKMRLQQKFDTDFPLEESCLQRFDTTTLADTI